MVQNTVKSIKLFGEAFKIVSEIEQRDRHNTLYLFARVINKVCYVKFGEAFEQSIWDRYNSTGCSQHSEMIHVWQSEIHDKTIHDVLKNSFDHAGNANDNPLHSKEVYIMHSAEEIYDFINAVTDIVNQKKIGPDFYRDRCGEQPLVPRTYQANMINSAISILNKNNRVLLNISTRAGKSYISLKICKELGAKNILIFTPFPKAEDSFKQLGECNIEFSGYKYIHLDAETDKSSLCDKNIIFCSYQFYNDSKQIVKDTISSLYFDVVILDECHHTSDSQRTFNILNNIKYNKLVYMSGTPFNDIYSGYFNKDEVVTFDFVDFIKYAKVHTDEISLPKLYVKTIDNLLFLQSKMCTLDKDIFTKADAFDYSVIFSNEIHAESFFKWLLQPVETQDYIINKPRWFDLNNQKHIIAFFNNNDEVAIAKKALDRVWPYGSNSVVQISGDEADKEFCDSDEQKINNLFNGNEHTLILTCNKLTTGVTLPKLDTVWYFKNSSSSEQFIQILFRTMTPCKGKDEVSMFCFDTEATLKVVRDYTTVRRDFDSVAVTKDEDNDTVKNIVSDILSCFNFMYLNDKFDFEYETVDSYFIKVHNLPFNHDIRNVITNYNAFYGVDDLGTEEISDKDLIVVRPKDEAIRGNCDRNNKLKKSLSRRAKNCNTQDKQETPEKVKRQIQKILINMDKLIFVYNNIETYEDFKYLWPEELKKYEDNFVQLLKDNKLRIHQMIEDIRYRAEHNIKDFLMGLSNSNSTDMKTPDSLLEKMFSKMSNVDGIICDPCCGCGTMLEYAHNKYNIPEEDLYGIELEEINVKVCNRLGYINVIQGDATDPKTWKTLLERLNRNTNKMKFDHIIMNPPYCRNLHLKILNEAIKYSDDVVNLSPIRWLQDPLAEYKKNSDFKKFENVRNRIESIEVINAKDASDLFNANMWTDLGIYHLTKNNDFNSKFLWKNAWFVNKVIFNIKDSIANHLTPMGVCNFETPYIKVSELHGHQGTKDFYDFVSPIIEVAKSKKASSGHHTVNFSTEKEATNFFNSLCTKFYRFINKCIKFDMNVPWRYAPYLGDYTHPWTDKDLYEYFDLTPEEIYIIESEIDETNS